MICSRFGGPVGGAQVDFDFILRDLMSLKGPPVILDCVSVQFLFFQHWMRRAEMQTLIQDS